LVALALGQKSYYYWKFASTINIYIYILRYTYTETKNSFENAQKPRFQLVFYPYLSNRCKNTRLN
jgi:hypothetical protein